MAIEDIPAHDGPSEWRQICGWVRMVDGTVHRVTTTTADRIGYGHAARKNDWPTMGSKNMDVELWQTFLLYHALFRTGVYSGPFEQFANQDSEVVQVDEAGAAVNPTGPTQ